jgi:spore coat polysaccharide biosynthesis predicted glycosyltransferase SpsG
LADELRLGKVETEFWIDGDAEAGALASRHGHRVALVHGAEPAATLALIRTTRPSAVVVDSYGVDADFFTAIRPATGCLMAIDDLAERFIDADIVQNGNADAGALIYQTREPCILLLGPTYTLLRPEFRQTSPPKIEPLVTRVLLTLGGTDPLHSTEKILIDLVDRLPRARFDVVVGPFVSDLSGLRGLAEATPGRVVVHQAPENLASLMKNVDLAVTGGGQTLYEVAALGVPTVALCLAANQVRHLAALAALGTLVPGGRMDEEGRFQECGDVTSRLAADPAWRQRMSLSGTQLLDGMGAVRTADVLARHLASPRKEQHVRS